MRVDSLIVKELNINGKPWRLPGLKRVELRTSVEVGSLYDLRKISLTEKPSVTPFDGRERPFTVPVDFRVEISLINV